jgi:molybdate transport system substrate-binding protein
VLLNSLAKKRNIGPISHKCPIGPISLLLIAALLVFLPSCTTTPSNPIELTVAAAADLTPAFEEVGKEFQATEKIKVVFNFGSSGMLARQIENGAPIDLFASANVDYVNQLEQKGLIVPDTKRLYARGRITLWTLKDSPLQIETITDLTRPEVKRIAIANPEHAPYGMAARDALQRSGIWEAVKPKLVYGENIRQTLQYAQSGNVEVAIVALSLSMQSDGRSVLIPEGLHKPLDQGLAVIKGTKNEQAARKFADFILDSKGQAIMKRYGFTLPSAN